MNLVFDVALPTDLKGQEDAIQQTLENSLNADGERIYHVKITFDIGAVEQ